MPVPVLPWISTNSNLPEEILSPCFHQFLLYMDLLLLSSCVLSLSGIILTDVLAPLSLLRYFRLSLESKDMPVATWEALGSLASELLQLLGNFGKVLLSRAFLSLATNFAGVLFLRMVCFFV